MDGSVVEREGAEAGRSAARVRRSALWSIASAVAIAPAMGLGALVLDDTGKLLGVLPWLMQVVFGLNARSLGKHELARIDALHLPVPLAEAEVIRKWGRVGFAVGMFGIVGAVLLLIGFLWLLVGLASALRR